MVDCIGDYHIDMLQLKLNKAKKDREFAIAVSSSARLSLANRRIAELSKLEKNKDGLIIVKNIKHICNEELQTIAEIVEIESYGKFLLQDGKLTQLHHTGEPNELT